MNTKLNTSLKSVTGPSEEYSINTRNSLRNFQVAYRYLLLIGVLSGCAGTPEVKDSSVLEKPTTFIGFLDAVSSSGDTLQTNVSCGSTPCKVYIHPRNNPQNLFVTRLKADFSLRKNDDSNLSNDVMQNFVVTPNEPNMTKDSGVLPYSVFENISLEEYWFYVLNSIQSSEDIRLIMRDLNLYRSGDGLVSPLTVLIAGGDCDNLSWMAKVMLDHLGKKNGHDFKGKVFGFADIKHAFTVFYDVDGQWKVLDQGAKIEIIPKNPDGSMTVPEDWETKGSKVSETVAHQIPGQDDLLSKLGIEQIDLDPETLKNNYVETIVSYPVDMPSSPDLLKSFLPADYEKYQECTVLFENGSFYYSRGVLIQIQMSSDDPEVKGVTIDPVEGLKQVNYIDSSEIDVDLIRITTGEKQRNFKDGKIVWYDSEGNIIQSQP